MTRTPLRIICFHRPLRCTSYHPTQGVCIWEVFLLNRPLCSRERYKPKVKPSAEVSSETR